ncbi:N-acetylmuramoyl-L-alanine amidase [Haloferula sp. BvORR071]|uniref:N-acetylmuramoyl-L-alanine amidase family protein n=1 Tax=Haloferula sp. BvORR071 TaxID=1396141 RepID=UPI000555B0CC|nr:N-acetylmuramoyl-L-alanine amidase [Haloferula sp. BvORR071]
MKSVALLVAILSVARGELPIVVIDAGHGGSGAELDHSSPNNAEFKSPRSGETYSEKDLTLELSKEIARLVNESGQAKAVLTRTSDVNVGMQARAKTADLPGAIAFVSIHFNSTPSAHGPVAVVQGEKYQGVPANTAAQLKRDKAFGDSLSKAVEAVTLKYDPASKAKPAQIFDRKPEGSHLFRYLRALERGKALDACFLEIEFIDNPKVAAWLLEGESSAAIRKEIAASVAKALVEHAVAPADAKSKE